jgi:hypothetical protein
MRPAISTVILQRSMQIRPSSGNSFWFFSAEAIADAAIEEGDITKVWWKGRKWMCKQDERTMNEIIGYHIASTVGLPIQPWIAA